MPELRPTVSADGNLLFFICENHPANTKYNSIRNSQDIWYSVRDSSGKWSEAIHLGYPLNTYHYNAVFWISPDNNRILIRNAFIDGDYVGNGVSMSYRTVNGGLEQTQMLANKKLSRNMIVAARMALRWHMMETHCCFIWPLKKTVYDNDIYVCFLQKDGTWTEPKSLGKKINLPGIQMK